MIAERRALTAVVILTDEFLPVFDVSDELAVVVQADAESTWSTLLGADLIDVGHRRPLVGLLGARRALPQIATELLHGKRAGPAPKGLALRDLAELPASAGGWILLGERPGQEIAFGLVGKFWRPVIEYAELDAPAFKGFSEPGYAKTVYAFGVRPLAADRTYLRARCAWRRRMTGRGVGFGATGRSASARAHTSWSTDRSTSSARTHSVASTDGSPRASRLVLLSSASRRRTRSAPTHRPRPHRS